MSNSTFLQPWEMSRSRYFRSLAREEKIVGEDYVASVYHVHGRPGEVMCWQQAWDVCGYSCDLGQFWITMRQCERIGSIYILRPDFVAEYRPSLMKYLRDNPQLQTVKAVSTIGGRPIPGGVRSVFHLDTSRMRMDDDMQRFEAEHADLFTPPGL